MLGEPTRLVDGNSGDTSNPCSLALITKGYKLSLLFIRSNDGKLRGEYSAEKDGHTFTAENVEELLGLVAMWETRGPDWKSKTGEPFVYEILYSEAFQREPDGTVIEFPMRWM